MTAETPLLLLRVAAAWTLPGLGLLVLPDGPTPHLAACALHTALAVEARLPHGPTLTGGATVEEVSRPADTAGPTRGLLLDLGTTQALPAGTAIWLLSPALTLL